MRVMLDTNILISAFVFKSKKMNELIFITGDKDFDDINIDKPDIMNATEFLDKYCK